MEVFFVLCFIGYIVYAIYFFIDYFHNRGGEQPWQSRIERKKMYSQRRSRRKSRY